MFFMVNLFLGIFFNYTQKTVCYIGYNIGSPTLRWDTVGRGMGRGTMVYSQSISVLFFLDNLFPI